MRVVRSDSGSTHRLSLSARVLSAADSQVKAKRQRKTAEEALLAPAESAARRTRKAGQKQAAAGWIAAEFIFYPGNICPVPPGTIPKAAAGAKGLFGFAGAIMVPRALDLSHEIHGCCDHRRWPCRLDRRRNARARRHFCHSCRSAPGISARFSRRK